MGEYLGKILLLLISSLYIIHQYYNGNNHGENFNGYAIYVLILALIYGVYKYFQLADKKSDSANMSLPVVIGFAGLHLLLLSGMFFVYQGDSFALGIPLFFKILGFLILPIIFSLISISVGNKILSYIEGFNNENQVFQNVISLVFGFFLVLTTIVTIGMLGFYNIYSVIAILGGYGIFSWKKVMEYINYFMNYEFSFSKTEGYGFKLLSTELLFILATLLLSVNLISAFRPFPIGWDDLGAYMNFAQLLAKSGTIFNIDSMFSWQSFTGIGYIFNSPTQAFFLNNLGGILSFLLMVAIFSDLLQSKTKKFFINIPLLLATIFIAMPMFIFEQAKDMKLDPGLYFVSISSIYLTLKLLLHSESHVFKNKILGFFGNKHITIGSKYIYFFIIGILLGFSFSIKFTSLLLISGVFALLFFARLGLAGLFGYIGLFFAIFTKFGLWKMMNISYPSDNLTFVNNFSGASLVLGIMLLGYAISVNLNQIKAFGIKILSVFLGIIVALLPWFMFNLSTSDQINISTLLSGEADYLKIDYTKLYSQDELDIKTEKQKEFDLSSTGTTGNEDWGRYFGYEEGINNYVKLPWNLSMQVNQKGEFTDITYIYLALLPLLLLFLPFRSKYYYIGILMILVISMLIFSPTKSKLIHIDTLSNIDQELVQQNFVSNKYVLNKGVFNDDIYDINFDNYISSSKIIQLVKLDNKGKPYTQQDVDAIENLLKLKFYEELSTKVTNVEFNDLLSINNTELLSNDKIFIQKLRNLYHNNYIFKPEITSVNTIINDQNNKITDIWIKNRTIQQYITEILSQYTLPGGYALLFIGFIIPLLYLLFVVQDSEKGKIFKLITVFTFFYTFLWTIAAYGVVWYGIALYFGLLLIIGICMFYATSYDNKSTETEKQIKGIGSFVIFTIIAIYFFASSVPHAFTNLQGAAYKEFKKGEVASIESPFLYHQDYLKIIYELNIEHEKKSDFINNSLTENTKQLIAMINSRAANGELGIQNIDVNNIENLVGNLRSMRTNASLGKYHKDISHSLINIYKGISYPSEQFKNTKSIYRIGTFLKYYISENNKRLFEDALVTQFDTYIKGSTPDDTVENMKKLGLNYFLVDLNAATIDNDPRRNLTKRYEGLLETFTSDKLEFISSDSICLRLGRELYFKGDKTSDSYAEYLSLAGVNHSSISADGTVIPRVNKQYDCYNKIIGLIAEGKVNNNDYSYLLPIQNYISDNPEINKDTQALFNLLSSMAPHGYKVLFRIK